MKLPFEILGDLFYFLSDHFRGNFFHVGSSLVRKNIDVSSTNASPTLFMCIPEEEFSSKHEYLVATDHKIVSSTKVQIQDEAPDPCPVPRILLI